MVGEIIQTIWNKVPILHGNMVVLQPNLQATKSFVILVIENYQGSMTCTIISSYDKFVISIKILQFPLALITQWGHIIMQQTYFG